MSLLEKTYFGECPSYFKPTPYRHHVDDTFCFCNNRLDTNLFLVFTYSIHLNISFTVEVGEWKVEVGIISRNCDFITFRAATLECDVITIVESTISTQFPYIFQQFPYFVAFSTQVSPTPYNFLISPHVEDFRYEWQP